MHADQQPFDEATSIDEPSSGWRRARACKPNGNCVEINRSIVDQIGVRDSKQPTRVLGFGLASWSMFLADAATENSR